tara:strand:- start:889 stop:1269 length:381 start_codon:yes stop_codon:yes gene_type:complete
MKLLVALTLAACFTILPSCVTAEEVWKKGDSVAAFFICKDEEDIMELALADSIGRENFLGKTLEKGIAKNCMSLRPPALFIVNEVVGSYIDHKGAETSILKIVSSKNDLFIGYVVAEGVPGKDKGI